MNSEARDRQIVVLCEGFDDRSFWSGWLDRLGCVDRTERGKKKDRDAWGRVVAGRGKFAFRSKEDSARPSRIIVHPAGGRDEVRKIALDEYLGDPTHVYDGLVLNLDSDDDGAGSVALDVIEGVVRAADGETTGEGRFRVGETEVVPVVWECDDPPETPGVPEKQTLERLVSASIVAAYPDRAGAIVDWLAAEPFGGDGPKHHGYSYLAKWWAEHGADDFFRELWRDDVVARELEQRLRVSGAWARIEALVAG